MVSAAMPPRRDGAALALRTASDADGATEATDPRAHCRPTSRPSVKVRPRITTTAQPSTSHWPKPGPPPDRRRAPATGQSRSPARLMLSGAETPSRSSPLRTTWPTAAQRASRARVVARSGVMIRCAL